MAKKTHSIAAKIPQSRAAAEAEMRELGKLRIRVAEIDNTLKEESQKLIQAAKDKSEPINAKIKVLEAGLMLYADAHRAELTDGNKSKRGKMLSGYFDWRKLPDSVSLKGVPAVIERIRKAIKKAEDAAALANETSSEDEAAHVERALKLRGFLRITAAANKEAMLADPALAKSITGVTIKSPGERLEIVVHENSLKD